mgnify:CR=1 FL=1
MHREREDVRRHKPAQMFVNGGRLPAGIGENRAVNGSEVPMGSHQRERGGLDAGAKTKHAKTDRGRLVALPGLDLSMQHHAASATCAASG